MTAINPIDQPQRGDICPAPGERGEPLGEPSVTRGHRGERFGGERLCKIFQKSTFEPQHQLSRRFFAKRLTARKRFMVQHGID